MQGEVPYRDFLFNYTPGILWVNALLMKAFGVTLMATRIGLLAFKLITLMTLFQSRPKAHQRLGRTRAGFSRSGVARSPANIQRLPGSVPCAVCARGFDLHSQLQ